MNTIISITNQKGGVGKDDDRAESRFGAGG